MRRLARWIALTLPFVTLADNPLTAADKDGWIDLLKTGPETPWVKVDTNWKHAEKTALNAEKNNRLVATGQGDTWVNGETGRVGNLITKQDFKDVEVHVEFLLGKNSNSGIKFQAVYEIQLRDTGAKKGEMTGDDCGGVYPRAEEKPKYHHIDKGVPPRVNAAKPAGEWQTLVVQFQAPRLNDKGEKSSSAKIVKATLNDKVIHENAEFQTPTGANWKKKEAAAGPFMLQADHGPVAFRNVRIRELK